MSTEIRDVYGDHRLTLTQYWGGDERGVCLQLTGNNCDHETFGFVGLTVRDAYETAKSLIEWVQSRAVDQAEKH